MCMVTPRLFPTKVKYGNDACGVAYGIQDAASASDTSLEAGDPGYL